MKTRYRAAELIALGLELGFGQAPLDQFSSSYLALLGRPPSAPELDAARALLEPPPVPPSASSTCLQLPELTTFSFHETGKQG